MTITNNMYEGEPLVEMTIVVPQTVYNWLAARADAENAKDRRNYVPEDAASAEVTAAMEYFLELAESEQELIERGIITFEDVEAV